MEATTLLTMHRMEGMGREGEEGLDFGFGTVVERRKLWIRIRQKAGWECQAHFQLGDVMNLWGLAQDRSRWDMSIGL